MGSIRLKEVLITQFTKPDTSREGLVKEKVLTIQRLSLPTARMESVRMLVQIAVQENWLLHQMDVKGAYLHATTSRLSGIDKCPPRLETQ